MRAARRRRQALAVTAMIAALLVLPCVQTGDASASAAAARTSTAASPPHTAPPPTAMPATLQPTGVGWRLGQEAWLSIPSISLLRRVYPGDQGALDAGLVTHYRSPIVPPPVAAGAPGVYWLAGHRTTHGATFATLGGLRLGDTVIVTPRSGGRVVYRITSVIRTGTVITTGLFYGPHRGAARLMLQTCDGSTRRLLAFGEKVT